MGVVDLDGVQPEPGGAAGGGGEGVTDPGQALAVEGERRVLAGVEGDRRRGDRLPAVGRSGGIWAPPSQGTSDEALRPAWASWMAMGTSDQPRTAFSVRAIAASVSSE